MTENHNEERRIKRINFEMDEQEANEFKSRLALDNTTMADKMKGWIRDYMKDYNRNNRTRK